MPKKHSLSRIKLSKSDLALWFSASAALLLLTLTLGWEDSRTLIYGVFIIFSIQGVLDLLNWLQHDDFLPSVLLLWALAALAMITWLLISNQYQLLIAMFGLIPWLAIAALGVSRGYRAYLHWSAKRGKARDQYRLAERYYYGNGVKEDLEKAVNWYHQAAQQRYSKAERKLSRLYKYGEGVPKDQRLADEWRARSRRNRD